jgi:D-alanyl-D-alanine carboxypeptidase (penicillin-binding protein 5/6)
MHIVFQKKCRALFVLVFGLLAVSLNQVAMAAPAPTTAPLSIIIRNQNVVPPQLTAEAACVMVAGSKQVLFEKDAHKIMYPASTTKMMTLITALKYGNMNDTVVVSPTAADIEGSSIRLNMLDRMTLRDLLYGVMLSSGNDASYAVAEHVGGGNASKFIGWMNEEARRVGALKTHFTNPHGLPDPVNHFTTAYDLGLIADAGFRTPGFEAYVSTAYKSVDYISRGTSRPLVNTNKLLLTYPGANGVKTGETREAGKCLVASARRGDKLIIAVVLNTPKRFEEAAALLDFGFKTLGL